MYVKRHEQFEICYNSKWDQITQVGESGGSAVGDISIHQGDQAADISCAVPLRLKSRGTRPPRPPPIDAHVV